MADAQQPTKKARTVPPLRIGGVPEHFNYPWHLAQKEGIFDRYGVEVEFVEQKCGTGAMIEAVKSGAVDVVIALTEGLVSDIAKGSDLRLLGTYVQSPLCWAVSTGKDSGVQTIDDLKGGKFGISRFTSGSHLMAYVLASQRGWDPQTDISFEVKGNFQKLRDGVNDNSTQAFMWETFTTKPFHDSGEIQRVGDITTPWPCFMLAARQLVLTEKLERVQAALAAVHEAAQKFHSDPHMPETIAKEYGLQVQDAQEWYKAVRITADRFISEAALETVVSTLKSVGVLSAEKVVPPSSLIDQRTAELRRDIKSMHLYKQPELVTALHKQLTAAGLTRGPLSYTDLLPFDQHHYHGTQAVDALVDEAGITERSRIINVGSGLGGPARYLAGKVGCQVLACELQDDLHRTASELTSRAGLGQRVIHLGGDFMQLSEHLQRHAYDHVVSWLTVLHIADRVRLFKQCYDLLRPGGWFFAADFFELNKLSEAEWTVLNDEVSCPSLATLPIYQKELELAGFKVVTLQDVTADWKAYTATRVEDMAKDAKLKQTLGDATFEGMLQFYSVVRDLYQGGNLGGLRVLAQKPLGW